MKKSELKQIIKEEIKKTYSDVELGRVVTDKSHKPFMTESEWNKKHKIQEVVEDSYEQNVECDFDYHGVKYKGKDIEYIYRPEINLVFNIDIEYKRSGINGMYVNNIKGPEILELEIETYNETTDETLSDLITLQPNWEEANKEVENEARYIGIEDEIQITLKNDQDGNIVIDEIEIPVKEL